MEVRHASLSQVRTGRDGRTIMVTDDLLDVVRHLQEVDPRLGVNYIESGGYFAIVGKEPNGDEWLVTTAQELDSRVVDEVRYLASSHYDAGKAVDRMDDAANRAADHRFAEKMGEISEKLAHALRKDLQLQHRVYLPAGVRGT